MNRKVIVSLALLLVLAVVVACAPAPTPVPPPAPTTAPVATAAPAATAVPPTSAPAATAAPATKAPAATTAPTVAPPPTNTPPATVMFGGTPIAGRTQVVWYVGLGAGGDPEVIPKEKAWVEKYNASQNEIQLILQVVHNPESYDTLKAQIAAGNPPDIVGPVGKAGRASFTGSWADISPLAQAANVDLTKYDPALLEFTKDEGVLVGIPFALFPSFLYYNKDLFDEAKLPYPPHKVGDKYQGKDWTLDTMAALAQKLTVDKNGNDATNAKFDPKNVKQFGFHVQYTDARGIAVLFGGGLPYDPKDMYTAKIPDNWRAAWKWYYDSVWKSNYAPNNDYQQSDLLAKGNPFSSGNIAMAPVHTWYTCCFDMKKMHWDIAVLPTVNGKITAKLHGDTFAIMKGSKNQKAAFKVLSQMVVSKDLYDIYGGMPAIPEDRPGFFANLDTRTAPNKIDWSVAQEMIKYPDIPNHEAWLPNLTKANDLFGKFRTTMDTQPGLNMDTEIDKLQAALDAVFKEVKK